MIICDFKEDVSLRADFTFHCEREPRVRVRVNLQVPPWLSVETELIGGK